MNSEFTKLTDYLQTLHVVVKFGEINAWFPSQRIIFIDDSKSSDEQLIALIHELGHVIQPKADSAYKGIDSDINEVGFVRGRYRCELRAWQCGTIKAAMLGVHFDIELYQRNELDCLESYLTL